MIYHTLTLDPVTGKARASWWAVHAETLTPIRVTIHGSDSVSLEIIGAPEGETPVFSSHPNVAIDPAVIQQEVLLSIRCHLAAHARLKKVTLRERKEVTLPEYLLVFDHNGENPACFRTSDPHLIIPASQPEEEILGQPLYWRTSTDLPATGWEYWWTDCQLAWDAMVPDLLNALKPTH